MNMYIKKNLSSSIIKFYNLISFLLSPICFEIVLPPLFLLKKEVDLFSIFIFRCIFDVLTCWEHFLFTTNKLIKSIPIFLNKLNKPHNLIGTLFKL